MAVLLIGVGMVEGEEGLGDILGGDNLPCVTPHYMELGLEATWVGKAFCVLSSR